MFLFCDFCAYQTVVLQPVVRKCTEVLSRVIGISGGDFYVRRFHKDGHCLEVAGIISIPKKKNVKDG